MTKKELAERIKEVLLHENDPEKSHWLEDAIMYDFIEGISNGSYKPKESKEMALMIMQLGNADLLRFYS